MSAPDSLKTAWWLVGPLSMVLYPLLHRKVASGTDWLLHRILPSTDRHEHEPN